MMLLQKLGLDTGKVIHVADLETMYMGLTVDLEVVRKAICKDLTVHNCNLILFASVPPFCKPPENTVASYLVTEADNMGINLNWAYIVTYE